MTLLKKILSNETLTAILMILLTTLLTHGLLIARLGYYHDDWYMLWSGASRGADSLMPLFSMDRPFMGVIYSYFYRIIGQNPAGWHLFALALRAAGGMAFYWVLKLTWPKYQSLFVLSAMLFVVFPGFLAEPNAATKVNHLIGYGAALFSIGCSLQAVRTRQAAKKYAWSGAALLLMAFYLWIYEYMIGLEVMRAALLFWAWWQGDHREVVPAAKKLILNYIPYLLVMGAFVFWRVFIFESTRPATDLKGLVTDYQTNFFGMAMRLAAQVVKDFFSASTFAWGVQPYHLATRADLGGIAAALLMAVGTILLAAGYLRIARKPEAPDGETPSPWIMIGIGSLIVLGAVAPVVASNRHIDLLDAYKSYALHPSAGALILIIGIVAMMRPKFRNTVLVILLGFSVATQSLNIQKWADYWEVQREFWWQLTWRAPDIRDNTLVMAYLPEGYVFQQDYEIWGPVNLIYRPDPLSIPHIQAEVINTDTMRNVFEGKFTDPYVRDIFLPRDYKNTLIISQPTIHSCIHVIDGTMPVYSTSERLIIEKVGEYSKVDFIDPSAQPQTPPAAVFGKEPEHGWCYSYQQATLARQAGNWQRIGELFDAAQAAGLAPSDASEYFVFIEGLTNLGRADEARQIAGSYIKENPALKYSLCKSLEAAPDYPEVYGYRLDEIRQTICP